ncbi:uncharacterized protein [Venturia canescens]|uniref:uncharacterized protein n=1 Tax=Venturia canescens TaxID=32260 RepID=UPI001C9C1064|nr:uncharacterized protein LOC122407715 [Venturia canescens]
MSKLEIFLWAATTVVFALTTSTSSKSMIAISNSSKQAQYFINTFLKDVNASLIDDVQDFARDIENRYTNARPLIDAVISSATKQKKLRCRSYFNRYERTGKAVIEILKNLYPRAFENGVQTSKEKFFGDSKNLENLTDKIIQQRDQLSRKVRSVRCTGRNCDIRKLNNHKKLFINGATFENPKYRSFCIQEHQLFNKTMNCLEISFFH